MQNGTACMDTKDQTPAVSNSPIVPPLWLDHLRHMLGADSKSPGYRNHFCAEIGYTDHKSMMEMVTAGLVTTGQIINDGRDQYFHATLAGCKAIGLSNKATKRAFED